MKPHGGQRPIIAMARNPHDPWSAPGARGYRNLFGTANAGEMYRGYLDMEDGEERTRDLLDRVAQRMAQSYGWPDRGDGSVPDDNPAIASGYVYLSQLVGHDLTFLGSTFPSINDALLDQQNLRTIALNLDTVYGGGPLDKPFAYRAPARNEQPRILLRLGRAGGEGADPRLVDRDLPRIGCPHLNGPDGRAAEGLTDVLIADPRNDAQPMLAQMLVLFHLLHNEVCRRLRSRHAGLADREAFAAARAIVTEVYTTIIRQDLLARLLNARVRDFYENNPDAPIERTGATGMPVEFSHAAFRCGHVMLRPGYQFNSDNIFGLRDTLQVNSSSLPEAMPLSRAWLIDWSLFFPIHGSVPNPSRRIAPYYVPFLHDQRAFGTRDGAVRSLPHRDLLRGASVHMRSVHSLIEKLPASLRDASPVLSREDERARMIVAWLEAGTVAFSDEDKAVLSRDPPLHLFLLLEAAQTENGERLGVLGSVIVAEVLYRALRNVKTGAAAEEDREAVFGRAPPETMPDLIVWLADSLGLADPEAGFVGSRQGRNAY